jgi:hypothetical protein
MNTEELEKLDDLTLDLSFDLSILNSAIKDSENLKLYELTNFVERIYQDSEKIRKIFDNEIRKN